MPTSLAITLNDFGDKLVEWLHPLGTDVDNLHADTFEVPMSKIFTNTLFYHFRVRSCSYLIIECLLVLITYLQFSVDNRIFYECNSILTIFRKKIL
jgi:hypothetical protein